MVDQWCYLGTAKNEMELEETLTQGQKEFDMDTYQLLKKSLTRLSTDALLHLTHQTCENEPLDTFA